jgi:hypothetical protein
MPLLFSDRMVLLRVFSGSVSTSITPSASLGSVTTSVLPLARILRFKSMASGDDSGKPTYMVGNGSR